MLKGLLRILGIGKKDAKRKKGRTSFFSWELNIKLEVNKEAKIIKLRTANLSLQK